MKSLINIPLLVEQLKRFWVIGLLMTAGYLLFIIIPLDGNAWQMVNLLSMRNGFMLFSAIVGPLCVVLALFSHSFSLRAATAYASFPINKRQLFCTHVLAGAVLLIVPLVILCLLLLTNPVYYTITTVVYNNWIPSGMSMPNALFPHGIIHGTLINSFGVVAGFFTRSAVTLLFYFAVFCMAACVSGNKVITLLLCALFPFVPMGLYALAELIAEIFIFGYEDFLMGEIAANIAIFTNPVAWMSAFFIMFDPVTTSTPPPVPLYPYYISYTLIPAALLAGAYACTHKRKAERAGDSVVFYKLKNVLVFAMSFLGMMVMGLFMVNLFGHVFFLFFGFVLGFAGTYFIAQMIAEKTFHIGGKAKYILHYSGTMLGLCIAVMVLLRIGFIGYENHVPDPQDVVGVRLSQTCVPRFTPPADSNNPSRCCLRCSQHGRPQSFSASAPVATADADIIHRTIAVHSRIVDDKSRIRGWSWQDIFLDKTTRGEFVHKQYVAYLLTNGKTVLRGYLVSADYADSIGLIDLTLDEKIVLYNHPILLNPQQADSVHIRHNDKTTEITDPATVAEVLEVLKNDVLLREIERDNELAWVLNIGTGTTLQRQLEDKGVLKALPRASAPAIPANQNIEVVIINHSREEEFKWSLGWLGRNQQPTYIYPWLFTHGYIDPDDWQ